MNATMTMARKVVELTYAELPTPVITKCKELILDAIACGIGGSRTPIGHAVLELVRQMGGHQHSKVLGSDFRGPCGLAAYANASAMNAQDYDDTGKSGHPGSSIISSALALGEKLGRDGQSIILACITGYEIGTRVAAAIEPSWERYRQIHGIGTAQTFGSMAACAKLLELDLATILNAFGVAGATAPVAHAGKFGWTDKSIAYIKDNVAWPAEAGLRAALLAQMGYEGSESILDGNQGYWVMAGSDRCDFERLTDFSEYEMMNVSLKPYPCCRWIHTTLDALGELVAKNHFESTDIMRIEVFSTQPLADYFGRQDPRTFVDVEFSIPCALSLKLHGIPHSVWYRPENWKNPGVLDLASRVRVSMEAEYQDLYLKLGRASSRIPARVEVILNGGEKLVRYCDFASGSPQKPMEPQARRNKVLDLTGGRLAPESQNKLIREIEDLDGIDDIRRVLADL
ncbi:MAG: MmgE/PrpD family protein [bacterium]|nr:MmgE/PrpD family protein [bacterium]